MSCEGAPFVGILHSTDASGGAAIPIFKAGSLTAHTLDLEEYLEIHSIQVVAAATGDTHIFIGPDSTPGTGETVLRGDFAANGGLERAIKPVFAGQVNQGLWAIAPAGNFDVVVNGTIRNGGNPAARARPSWREDLM